MTIFTAVNVAGRPKAWEEPTTLHLLAERCFNDEILVLKSHRHSNVYQTQPFFSQHFDMRKSCKFSKTGNLNLSAVNNKNQ